MRVARNKIAEFFEQLDEESAPDSGVVVVGAGTGGTSATIGRFIRYRRPRRTVSVSSTRGIGVLPGVTRRRTPTS